MDYSQFKQFLQSNMDSQLVFQMTSGELVPEHFHVTEVGKVTKEFVDCGGVQRTSQACVLQTLVANDVDHRLTAGKLSGILDKAAGLGLAEDLSVEVEVQRETIGTFEIANGAAHENQLVFELAAKQTQCLAPDRCGLDLPVLGEGCCSTDSDCC